ncbi:MAG: ABC transporter permease [Acidobacteria bacterium]|nr:ABC transporter permease [Acidobacteriota bacterium]
MSEATPNPLPALPRKAAAALLTGGVTAACALGLAALLLFLEGVDPSEVFLEILDGAFGSFTGLCLTLHAWVAVLIAVGGLLIAFAGRLWNIGMEGQICMGAIAAVGVMRALDAAGSPPGVVVASALAAGVLGGAFWAALAGVLKTAAKVHEIFGGLGLNFIAMALAVWLVFGPWKRPGIGSMSGTEPFPDAFSLPTFPGTGLSPWTLAFGAVVFTLALVLLYRTRFGLRLRAVGINARAADRLGLDSAFHLQASLALCGAAGGLLGALQVTVVHHKLIPAISGGYGYQGLLVAILAAYRPLPALGAAFFFAAANVGAVRLPIVFQLDSTFAGVLTGAVVLTVMAGVGIRQRRAERTPEPGGAVWTP